MGTLQNHKDDEFIYSLGLMGQNDPSLQKKITYQFSNFKNLVNLFQVMARFFNHEERDVLLEDEGAEDDDVFREYKVMYRFYSAILDNQFEIQNEVKEFYKFLPYM